MQTNPHHGAGNLQLIILLAFLIPAIFFLLTQQKTLQAVDIYNRSMGPGRVWLQLIPFFGLLWQFLVVIRIAESIGKEMTAWNNDSILGFSDAADVENAGKKPTLFIGITYCLLIVIGYSGSIFYKGPKAYIFGLVTIAGMICWAIYWVQLIVHTRKLRRRHA